MEPRLARRCARTKAGPLFMLFHQYRLHVYLCVDAKRTNLRDADATNKSASNARLLLPPLSLSLSINQLSCFEAHLSPSG